MGRSKDTEERARREAEESGWQWTEAEIQRGALARVPRWVWAVAAVVLLAAVAALALALRGGSRSTPPPPTDTPLPTSTRTPRPTDTPLPTSTPTPRPTNTPRPTRTPTPPPTNTPVPQAGEVRVRQVDGMEMVYVPAGEFLMGSTDEEIEAVLEACPDCFEPWIQAEAPQHIVSLDAYWLDKTEVTNAQYRRCMDAGVCKAPSECDVGHPTYDDAAKADHPVVCVRWIDAKTYCEWAGARLPTEAEWEKAARGTDGQAYPWGERWEEGRCNSSEAGIGDTTPVGSYPQGASPYGALDMAGNVEEILADWYDEAYYSASPSQDPQGPERGELRAARGGRWRSSPIGVRSVGRSSMYPSYTRFNLGFRCAASAAP